MHLYNVRRYFVRACGHNVRGRADHKRHRSLQEAGEAAGQHRHIHVFPSEGEEQRHQRLADHGQHVRVRREQQHFLLGQQQRPDGDQIVLIQALCDQQPVGRRGKRERELQRTRAGNVDQRTTQSQPRRLERACDARAENGQHELSPQRHRLVRDVQAVQLAAALREKLECGNSRNEADCLLRVDLTARRSFNRLADEPAHHLGTERVHPRDAHTVDARAVGGGQDEGVCDRHWVELVFRERDELNAVREAELGAGCSQHS
mmetsp:Transcript_31206/g.78019  ORF Transcript_31206/g.78019 Transcript_31206/m.78019 type:complete len:261 (+) Transcript_31206:1901-2683(+)